MRRYLVLSALVGWLWIPSALAAQQTVVSSPGVMVLSPNKCSLANIPELNNWTRTKFAPILNDLVRQGQLTGWGVLDHNWGDEWTWVVYYTARDLATFQSAWREYGRRAVESEPRMLQRFSELCSEHKDNIYNIAMTEKTTQP